MNMEEQIVKKFEQATNETQALAKLAMSESERAEGLARELRNTRKIKRVKDTDIVKTKEGSEGRTFKSPKEHSYKAETGGIPGVTMHENKFIAVIHYKSRETGKDTTVTRRRESLIEAIIARNELSATLLRDGLIDFDKFAKMTSL